MRRTPAVVVALAVMGGLAAAIPAAAADGPAAIPQSHPQWATPGSKVADVAGGSTVTFRVYLRTRDETGAEALATAVSDPTNASYGRYLTAGQVRSRFAPTAGQVGSVRGWLGQAGFTIDGVPANNAYVEATGSAATVNKAFNVALGEYKVAGTTLRAANTDLSVPASLASTVLGVIGVDQSETLMKPAGVGGPSDGASVETRPGVVAPPAGFRNAQPCSQYWAQKVDTTDPAFQGQRLPYAPCGYLPSQVRGAYGINGVVEHGVNGRGVTVAIVDAFGSPTLYQDAAEYARINDPGHPLTTAQFSEQVAAPTPGSEDPTQCDAAGWYGEQTLDVEAVHAMAPGAHILFVGGADCQDLSLDASLNSVVVRAEREHGVQLLRRRR